MACTPPLGSKHTTPPLSSCGHLPTASTASYSMVTQSQTDRGHCLMRRACHPSWPGALLGAMLQHSHQSSSPWKGSGCQPAVRLGARTRSHFGACGFCQSGHQAASLAASKAFCPAYKPPGCTTMPVDCKLLGPSLIQRKKARMPPSVWAVHHWCQLARLAALHSASALSSSALASSTKPSTLARGTSCLPTSAHLDTGSWAMAALSCWNWQLHSGLPSRASHCCNRRFLKVMAEASLVTASPP